MRDRETNKRVSGELKRVIDVNVTVGNVDVKEVGDRLSILKLLGDRVMTAVSDFAARQQAFNSRIDSAVSGIQTDVTALNAKIEELQNSPGVITSEDQALLDDLQSRGESISSRLEALDALTTPVVPVPAEV